MMFFILVAVLVVAVLWWLAGKRRMSLNERLYLKRRGYAVELDPEPRKPVARETRLFGLIESLNDLSPYSRQRAADEISRMCESGLKDDRMLPALLTALDDGDAGVRSTVAAALGNFGDPVAVEALERRIAVEEAIQVRMALSRAVEKLTGPSAGLSHDAG